MTHRLATIISLVFDPFLMLAVVFVVILSGSPAFVPAFFVMVVLPLVLFIFAWKTRRVSNWDVSDRRQRPKILWTLVGIETMGTIAFQLWPVIPIIIVITVFTVITHFWKISGHAMAAALATGTLVAHYGFVWWPVLLVVGVVAWARVVRRDHTLAQVIAGALYSWIVLFVLNNYFV